MYNNEDYPTYQQPTPQAENPFKGLDLKLIIPFQAYQRIISYAQLAGDIEISGFADVEYNNKTHEFTMADIYLPPQKASGTDVRIDEEEMAKFNLDLIKKGHKQLPQIWWHSHNHMEAFFSGTDEATLKDLQNDTFMIALVVNNRGEMKAKMYVYTESKLTVTNALLGKETDEAQEQVEIDPLPVQVKLTDKDIQKSWKDEVKKKLEDKTAMKLPYKNPFKGIFSTKDEDDEEDPHTKQIIIPGKEDKRTEKKGDRRQKGAAPVVDEDFESRYTHSANVRVYRLPNDRKKAEKKIEEMKLEKSWNYIAQEYVYENTDTGDIWVDWWKVLPASTLLH